MESLITLLIGFAIGVFIQHKFNLTLKAVDLIDKVKAKLKR